MNAELIPLLNTVTPILVLVFALWVLWEVLTPIQEHLCRTFRRQTKQKQLNADWDKLVVDLLTRPYARQSQTDILRFVRHRSDYVIDGYFHALDAVEISCGHPEVRLFARKMGWLYYEYVLALHFIIEGRSCEVSPAQAIRNDIAARCEIRNGK